MEARVQKKEKRRRESGGQRKNRREEEKNRDIKRCKKEREIGEQKRIEER